MAHSNDETPCCSRVSALREELKQLKVKTKVEMENTLNDLEMVRRRKEEKDKQVAELMRRLNHTDNRNLFQRVASISNLHQCQSEMNLTNRFFNNHRLGPKPSSRCLGDDNSEVDASISLVKNISNHKTISSFSDSESDFDTLSGMDSAEFNYDHNVDFPKSASSANFTERNIIHRKKRNARRFEAMFKSKQERDAEALKYLNDVETRNKDIIDRVHNDIKSTERKILDWQHVIDHQSSQILCLRNEINEMKDQKMALAYEKIKHRNETSMFNRPCVSALELSGVKSLSFQKKSEFRGLRRMSRCSSTSNLSRAIYSGLGETKYASNQNTVWEMNNNETLDPRDMSWQTLASYYNERKAAAATGRKRRSSLKNTNSGDSNSSEHISALKKQNQLVQEKVVIDEMKLRALKFQLANEAFNFHGTKLELESKLKTALNELEIKKQYMKANSDRLNTQIMANNTELSSMRIRVGFMNKISGRCYKRLTDKVLQLSSSNDNQSNASSSDKKQHEIEILKRMISKASTALRKEIRARKGEQKAMIKSAWNKLDLEDIIKKASNCTSEITSSSDFTDNSNRTFQINGESQEKIKVLNSQSVFIRQKMKRLIRFYRCHLFLLIQRMNKDLALNNMQDKENMEETQTDEELPYLKALDAQDFDYKAFLKQLLNQRDLQRKQMTALQKELLELTKISKDNGQRKKKVFDELRSQLRHCVSRAKSKDIVISALELQIKQETPTQISF